MLDERPGLCVAVGLVDGLLKLVYSVVEIIVSTIRHHKRSDTDKRAEKRKWLNQQDEMRFSHSIQFNAVPDWSSHYIAYSNLKKL